MSSPESPGQSRRRRASLTREAVVGAAAEILDERGVDGLTMRAVAERLDAGAMSLYRHVSGREELLDLVIARLTAEIPDRQSSGDWRTDLALLARDMRAALLRRPNLTVLMTSRAGAAGGGLPTLDRALGILRHAGLSPADAAFANHALGNYVAGAALWEAVGLGGATGEARAQRARAAGDAAAKVPADAYPGVAWAAGALFAGTADDRFEFGLAVLMDGIADRAVQA
jgi:TetR/AcrR family transcriptional regulator, tetracycline repressor protein